MRKDQLFHYQEDGANWLATLSARRDCMLAWKMGTGKTPTTIKATELTQADKLLVLCPSVGRSMWRAAFAKWSSAPKSVTVIWGSSQQVPNAPGVVICSYDLLSRQDSPILRQLLRQDFDVLILDEAHYLKNPKAARTRAVYGKRIDRSGLAGRAQRVWALTGTPSLAGPQDIWTHLHALAPDTIEWKPGFAMSEIQFIERYCQLAPTPFGNKIVGARNTKELSSRVKPFMNYLSLEKVRTELKRPIIGEIPLSGGNLKLEAGLREAFAASERDAHQVVGDILTELSSDDPDVNVDKALAALKENRVAIATQRLVTGKIKAPIVAELIADELANNPGEKVILFAYHTEVIDALYARLNPFGPVRLDGRTQPKERERVVELFQTHPECRVFIGQVQAASTTITLTAAANVVFVEADYTPAINEQAICRAHRIGQARHVTARFALLEGSLDAAIMRILARKAKDVGEFESNLETNVA